MVCGVFDWLVFNSSGISAISLSGVLESQILCCVFSVEKVSLL
jgi:hypothetical protein